MRPCGVKIYMNMDDVYIVSIVTASVMLVLLIICFYVLARQRRAEELLRAEQDAVYSDPRLAKMEYDIAFYDDDLAATTASGEDEQVTIDDVIGADKTPLSAGESAIFTKADDGMEEISGHYEPEE